MLEQIFHKARKPINWPSFAGGPRECASERALELFSSSLVAVFINQGCWQEMPLQNWDSDSTRYDRDLK